jgi:hypothetical protein
MRDHDTTTRYRIELDMLERDSTLDERRAVALLRSEFALALNASYFMPLTPGEIHVGAVARSIPQEGVVRYAVELVLDERHPAISDEQAAELVQREFARAQNASHFLRIAREDFTARLVARERISSAEALRTS